MDGAIPQLVHSFKLQLAGTLLLASLIFSAYLQLASRIKTKSSKLLGISRGL
jgi:hypothetical protein